MPTLLNSTLASRWGVFILYFKAPGTSYFNSAITTLPTWCWERVGSNICISYKLYALKTPGTPGTICFRPTRMFTKYLFIVSRPILLHRHRIIHANLHLKQSNKYVFSSREISKKIHKTTGFLMWIWYVMHQHMYHVLCVRFSANIMHYSCIYVLPNIVILYKLWHQLYYKMYMYADPILIKHLIMIFV